MAFQNTQWFNVYPLNWVIMTYPSASRWAIQPLKKDKSKTTIPLLGHLNSQGNRARLFEIEINHKELSVWFVSWSYIWCSTYYLYKSARRKTIQFSLSALSNLIDSALWSFKFPFALSLSKGLCVLKSSARTVQTIKGPKQYTTNRCSTRYNHKINVTDLYFYIL